MNDEDEVLDLCNAADEVIGTIKRRDYGKLATEKLGYIRAVNAFIVNSDGKLWIPRRTAGKLIAPNGLDYSMSEHVKSGETYLKACIRGFDEELNMIIAPEDLIFVATSRPHSGLPYFFDSLYLCKADRVPKFNSEDFTEYSWMDLAELKDKLDDNETAKSSMKFWIKFLTEL